MTQINTASKTLARIEEKYFKGFDLAKASQLEGDERREFVLSQVERLLKKPYANVTTAMLLSDDFWESDEGRKPTSTPLLSLREQLSLTRDERKRCRLIVEVAGLCHDLSFYFPFDLKETFGINGKFRASNKHLVEWLNATKHKRVAAHVACTLKRVANSEYIDICYQPAQDALAEIFSREYKCLIREPGNTKMPFSAYTKTILDTLIPIEQHWQRGRRLKLNPEVVMLHDDIYGFVPRQFDKGVLEAAQELYDYMNREVRGRLRAKGKVASWGDMPKSFQDNYDDVMRRMSRKVREVRAKYFAKGRLEDHSLAFGYVLGQAEFIGGYMTSEEDEN